MISGSDATMIDEPPGSIDSERDRGDRGALKGGGRVADEDGVEADALQALRDVDQERFRVHARLPGGRIPPT